MLRKIKKSISVITIFSVLGVSLPSNLFADSIFSDALKSVNQARSWHDDNAGTDNYYMGSVYVRFASPAPPPIIRVSAPEVQASCSGINIKGMFVSLLNLDQLGSMLQNAGASLAWGVAVGLIYSLPGIANAFKMINDWAKRIQQILGNACQSGIAISQYYLGKAGMDRTSLQKKVDSYIDNAAKTMQDGMSGIAKSLGLDGIRFDQNGIIDLSGNDKLSKKEAVDAIGNMIKDGLIADFSLQSSLITKMNTESKDKVFKTMGLDISQLQNNDVKPVSVCLFANTTTNGCSNIDISTLVSQVSADQNEQNRWKLLWLFYEYTNKAIGDIYVNNNDVVALIKEAFDYLKNPTDENKAAAYDIISSPDKHSISIAYDGKGNMDTVAKELADVLIGGESAVKTKDFESHVITLIGMEANALNIKQSYAVNSKPVYQVNIKNLLGNWYGVGPAAQCAVADITHETNATATVISSSATTTNAATQSIQQVSCSDISYYVPPSLRKYEIIYLNSPTEDKPRLKAQLKKYLKYNYAIDLADYLVTSLNNTFGNKVRQFSTPPSDSNSTNSGNNDTNGTKEEGSKTTAAIKPAEIVNLTMQYSRNVSAFINAFEKYVRQEVKRDAKDYVSRDALDKLFNEQRIKNKTRGLKNVIAQ